MYNPTTAADYVYQEVRKMLMTAELQPGDRLVQRELAERFGTSHYPVIEATRRLEQDGLIVSYANRGAQVPVWTKRDAEGAFLVREALEGIACRFFAESSTEAARKKLVDLGKRFDKAVKRGAAQARCEADIALHMHIVQSTGSRTLVRSIENSCALTLSIHNASLMDSQAGDEVSEEEGLHDALIAALLSGDVNAAEKAGHLHVRTAMEHVMRHFK